jgi:hypothetical protein
MNSAASAPDLERNRTGLTRRALIGSVCTTAAALLATPAVGAQRRRPNSYSELRLDPSLEGDVLSQGRTAIERLTGGPRAIQPLSVTADLFTPQEVRHHRDRVALIARTAADCLDRTYADHVAFFNQHRVSKYYGFRRYPTEQSRIDALISAGKSPRLAKLQEVTACILLAKRCLREGFLAAGENATWQKIDRVMNKNGNLGTDLQVMLQQLEWEIYYWNPDPRKNDIWDKEDRKLNPLKPGTVWNPVWGGHGARFKDVKSRGLYSGKRVDNRERLVQFLTLPPAAFQSVSFFVGTAHDGYHVFPGRRGAVIEAHSMRKITDRSNLERSRFNPLQQPGGGPRWTERERYKSGLIVVPKTF